ncbi:MAG: aminotransferase class IV [Mariprofundales bacterium]|nr:aminotransferase class IV [Mariprofundales bacterium]
MPIAIACCTELDRAISLGEACFDTCRAIDGSVFAWEHHLTRLVSGATQLGITLDASEQQRIHRAVMQHATTADGMLRLTISAGDAPWGLLAQGDSPQVWLQHAPLPKPRAIALISMPSPRPELPMNAKFSSDYSIMLRSGGRAILQQGGMPLLWQQDRLLGTAVANIAIRYSKKWLTPTTAAGGVLPGIIRHHLLQHGSLHEAICSHAMVAQSPAIVLLNSGGFVQAATSIDGRPLDANHHAITELHAPFIGVDGTPW